jgi:hypothetical protein
VDAEVKNNEYSIYITSASPTECYFFLFFAGLRIRIRMDQHNFMKMFLDPDQHYSEELDPDPH